MTEPRRIKTSAVTGSPARQAVLRQLAYAIDTLAEYELEYVTEGLYGDAQVPADLRAKVKRAFDAEQSNPGVTRSVE